MTTGESDERDRCSVITEVAIEQAMDKCGSDEAVKDQLRRIVGFGSDDHGLEKDCQATLEEGLDKATLKNTRAIRQWVFCRAWELVRSENMTLSSAASKAWAEANAAGAEMGIEV